ncbi:(2Fe-2S)-binding protein [Methylophaga sp. 42_25_T18]|nr:(2Fe-2S)-binding protein [Methylophaga sp. 42_25_T18]OUR88856.1 (2Fe-2S)-binding protein [Methylophaga sp. 42_8_T64]
MSETLDPENEILCECSGTTRKKIESLIEQGIDDIDGISRKTGAVSGCGSCEWDLEDFLAEHVKQK